MLTLSATYVSNQNTAYVLKIKNQEHGHCLQVEEAFAFGGLRGDVRSRLCGDWSTGNYLKGAGNVPKYENFTHMSP
jgi:hypothetical protein